MVAAKTSEKELEGLPANMSSWISSATINFPSPLATTFFESVGSISSAASLWHPHLRLLFHKVSCVSRARHRSLPLRCYANKDTPASRPSAFWRSRSNPLQIPTGRKCKLKKPSCAPRFNDNPQGRHILLSQERRPRTKTRAFIVLGADTGTGLG